MSVVVMCYSDSALVSRLYVNMLPDGHVQTRKNTQSIVSDAWLGIVLAFVVLRRSMLLLDMCIDACFKSEIPNNVLEPLSILP